MIEVKATAPMTYIAHAGLKADYRCFHIGDGFEFRPGVNLLVGDQGTGKSSLLALLGDRKLRDKYLESVLADGDSVMVYRHDFERDNPRTCGSLNSSRMPAMFVVLSHFASHGETARNVMKGIAELGRGIILLDEPDASLSLRSQFALARELREIGEHSQVLAAVHSATVIGEFPEVLSLEHRRWLPAAEFLASQREPAAPDPQSPPPCTT